MRTFQSRFFNRLPFLLLCFVVHSPAQGAGMFLSERGVRGLGRGGAFVAGADDPQAMSYNPAGFAFAHPGAYADSVLYNFQGSYTRRTQTQQRDPNTLEPTGVLLQQDAQTVQSTSGVMPIPTLAAVLKAPLLGVESTFALGMYAPYAPLTSYPLTSNGDPSPQRYSLLSTEGSKLVYLGAWAAAPVSERVAVGFGVQILAGTFRSKMALSSCIPENCAPENPEWDAIVNLEAKPIVAPTGNLGVIVKPIEDIKVGASYQFATLINAPAQQKLDKPSSPLFENAKLSGSKARIKFKLPWILQTGIEWSQPQFKTEVAYVYEAWSQHRSIDIKPQGVEFQGVSLSPHNFPIQDVNIDRNFVDAWSIRMGGEYFIDAWGWLKTLRAGIVYEKSAIPVDYISVAALDWDKYIASAGFETALGPWSAHAVYAHLFEKSIVVDPGTAKQRQLNPIRTQRQTEESPAINGGKYTVAANIVGIGLTYQTGP
jgi:long-chain fatty acid transport protein